MLLKQVCALGVAAVLVAGCGGDTSESSETISSTIMAEISSALPPPSFDELSPTSRQFFLVRSGANAEYVEPVWIDDGRVPADVTESVRLAVAALLIFTGADLETANQSTLPGLESMVPPGTALNGVTVEGEVAIIDLGGALVGSAGSSSEERLFAEQLAHTALLDPSLSAIKLLIDGRPITTLWGHLDWSVPVSRSDAALSPVVIVEPLPTTVYSSADVIVEGWASVVEGTVLIRLEDSAGNVVTESFTTASEGAPGRGTWAWEVRVPGPGEWTVIAGGSDPSGGEGFPPFEIRRTFTVSG